MSVIACFPRYLEQEKLYSKEDYTTGEHWVGYFLGQKLYQQTLIIPMTDIPLTGLTTYNKYAHHISNISTPLFVKDVTVKNENASGSYSKVQIKMQAQTANTSQYHIYIEKFTPTEIWIIRGTSASSEADVVYITVQYFK